MKPNIYTAQHDVHSCTNDPQINKTRVEREGRFKPVDERICEKISSLAEDITKVNAIVWPKMIEDIAHQDICYISGRTGRVCIVLSLDPQLLESCSRFSNQLTAQADQVFPILWISPWL